MFTPVDGVASLDMQLGAARLSFPGINIGDSKNFIQTKPMDFGRPDIFKFIQYIRMDLTSQDLTVPTNLWVKLGWQTDMADAINWTPLHQVVNLNPRIPFCITGRFITFYMVDLQPFTDWKMTKLEFYGRMMGKGEGHK